MNETFAALGEPNRLRIFELLRAGPRSVNDIGERLKLRQPQVSKHLRVLKEAGLVGMQPRAQQRVYELRAQRLRQLHDWLERYRRIWDERFDALDELVVELTTKERLDGNRKGNERTTVERRSDRELVVARTFGGPARIVFEACTKPELVARWWAPRSLGVKLFSCDIDLRVGGRYRYVFGRDPKEAMAFSGVYQEITPSSRLVWTQIFEPMPHAGESVITATFEERDGKTTLVLHQRFASKEALDGALASGMERGMNDAHAQLEELVASLR